MDPLLIILRVLHVIAGVYVAGSYLFMVPILEPKLKRLGPHIQNPVMGALMPTLLPVNGGSLIILIGTGVAITFLTRGLNSLLVTAWGWAMLIGLVATVAVTVIGFGVIAPTGMRMQKIGQGIAGRAPSPEESQQLGRLSKQVETLSRVNFWLILVALATMLAARYL